MSSLKTFRILFIGDIVGQPGREAIIRHISSIKNKHSIDCAIANAENAAGGAGITHPIAEELFKSGIDAITLGDHVWDQAMFANTIHQLSYVCRPANLPDECPGHSYIIIEKNGFKLGITNLLGRQFMNTLRATCPFKTADSLIDILTPLTNGIVVDIHAEATSEKVALGWYLDGRISALIGTHTHIPTADSQILPNQTAYMTDAGMTGPYQSVLGREIEPIIQRFLDSMPRKMPVAKNNVKICGCILELQYTTGKATHIEPFCFHA